MRTLCLALFLVACAEPAPQMPPRESSSENVWIYRDAETGCQYLVYSGYKKGGITPRLNSDGQPVCGDVAAG